MDIEYLILKNSNNDHVVIPPEYKERVIELLEDSNFSELDNIIELIPMTSDYSNIEHFKHKKLSLMVLKEFNSVDFTNSDILSKTIQKLNMFVDGINAIEMVKEFIDIDINNIDTTATLKFEGVLESENISINLNDIEMFKLDDLLKKLVTRIW